jgi:hypothetical protein
MEHIKEPIALPSTHMSMLLRILLATFPFLHSPPVSRLRRINHLGPSLGHSFGYIHKDGSVPLLCQVGYNGSFQAGSKPSEVARVLDRLECAYPLLLDLAYRDHKR